MRWLFAVLVGLTLAAPVGAQQISPMTGTTDGSPSQPGGRTPGGRPQRAGRMGLQQRFDAANTTHDGRLTLEQARTGHMRQIVAHFDAIDAGHKGYVTVADIKAYRQAARAARKAAKAS